MQNEADAGTKDDSRNETDHDNRRTGVCGMGTYGLSHDTSQPRVRVSVYRLPSLALLLTSAQSDLLANSPSAVLDVA